MSGHAHGSALPRGVRRRHLVTVLLAVVGLVLLGTTPAAASEEETEQASLLVIQSIALIANGAPKEAVIERIEDALEAPDPSNTDLDAVEEALALVEESSANAGPEGFEEARTVLVGAVEARFATGYGEIPGPDEVGHAESPYATGAETGTTAVLDELRPAWGISDGGDTVLLVLAALAVGSGLYLARRWRPHASIRQLRRTMAGTGDPR